MPKTVCNAPIAALLIVGAACGPGTSGRVAHRGGAAYWPENSQLAIDGALSRDWDAVSFDVFLTQDRVPVLNAEPFIDEARCQTLGERPIDEEDRVWLLEVGVDELQAGYRCGGLPQDGFPDAAVQAAPIAAFEDLVAALEADDSPPVVHLMMGFQPNVSHDPAVFAAEILGRWALAEWYADAPELVVVAELPITLAAFRQAGEERGVTLRTTLSWPRLPPAGGEEIAGVGVAMGVMQGVLDPVADLDASGADGIRLHPAISTRTDARRLSAVADYVEVGPVHRRAEVKALSRWPVDAVLTSDPELP